MNPWDTLELISNNLKRLRHLDAYKHQSWTLIVEAETGLFYCNPELDKSERVSAATMAVFFSAAIREYEQYEGEDKLQFKVLLEAAKKAFSA